MPKYWSRIETAYKVKFKSEVDQLPQNTQRTLKRSKITGCWLSVMPSHVSGTILSSTEFCDAPICTRTFEASNRLRRLWRVQEV